MYLRNIATIYIFDEDKILLMHRVGSRLFQGDIWVGIGGHFEEPELNEPMICVLRELKEETGLSPEDIDEVELKYITTRKTKDEIRQQYIFFAKLKNKQAKLITSDEGTLHWIPLYNLFSRKMAYSNTECLKHYLENARDNNIYVGAVGAYTNDLFVQFTALKEYSTDK